LWIGFICLRTGTSKELWTFGFYSRQEISWLTDELPITVDARSKAWTVFARSDAGIVSSNPTQVMDVCVRLFCVCVVLCVGSGLATGW
jgi:hypothetical protein